LFARDSNRSLVLSDIVNSVMASPTVPPSFEKCDVLATIILMGTDVEPVSRSILMKNLHIKEGPIKTLLKRLEQNGLVTSVANRGHILSEEGRAWHQRLRERIVQNKQVRVPGLSLKESAYGIQLRGLADLVASGIEQRDLALLVGASGATTLTFQGGALKVPSVSGEALDKETLKELNSEFRLQDGDIVIVGMGRTPSDALRGAFNAALSLLVKLDETTSHKQQK
jgi:hypothetical protein